MEHYAHAFPAFANHPKKEMDEAELRRSLPYYAAMKDIASCICDAFAEHAQSDGSLVGMSPTGTKAFLTALAERAFHIAKDCKAAGITGIAGADYAATDTVPPFIRIAEHFVT